MSDRVPSLGNELVATFRRAAVAISGDVVRAAFARLALRVVSAVAAQWLAASGLRLIRQPQRSQHDSREANAEFLQRATARNGLGHAHGQFIEFVFHNFGFVLFAATRRIGF